MSKATTLDNLEVVPPALRRRWEKMYRQAKEQTAKLEALLMASGGIPPLNGESAPEVRSAPKPRAKRAGAKTQIPSRKKARSRHVKSRARRRVVKGPPEAPAPQVADIPPSPTAAVVNEAGKARHKAGTWTASIRDVVTPTDHPWNYQALKDALKETDVARLLERSDKAFYGALTKLEADGLIVRYKGHVFSPEGYSKFEDDFTAGRVRDLKFPNPAHHSPIGDAVTAMMKTRPDGAESGHIIWQLRRAPEFAHTMEKNKTHIYNVLARLVSQNVLRKNGKRYYYVPVMNEAPPNGESGGASTSSGEDGSSSRGQGAA